MERRGRGDKVQEEKRHGEGRDGEEVGMGKEAS